MTTNDFKNIGEKWRSHGLRGIWRDKNGEFYIDDNDALGPYYFGLVGDIEVQTGRACRFHDMPENGKGLEPLWVS